MACIVGLDTLVLQLRLESMKVVHGDTAYNNAGSIRHDQFAMAEVVELPKFMTSIQHGALILDLQYLNSHFTAVVGGFIHLPCSRIHL